MGRTNSLAAVFNGSSRNTVLSWLLVVVLGMSLLGGGIFERYEPVLLGAGAIGVIVAPRPRDFNSTYPSQRRMSSPRLSAISNSDFEGVCNLILPQ